MGTDSRDLFLRSARTTNSAGFAVVSFLLCSAAPGNVLSVSRLSAIGRFDLRFVTFLTTKKIIIKIARPSPIQDSISAALPSPARRNESQSSLPTESETPTCNNSEGEARNTEATDSAVTTNNLKEMVAA